MSVVIGQEVISTNEIASSCTVHHFNVIMFEFILSTVLSNAQAHVTQDPEHVNRVCSFIVGIPYASDNFTDEEWERFKVCRQVLEG